MSEMNFEILSHDAYLGGVRFLNREDSPGVLCLHGMLENGGIFYSRSKKGLAPWLQKNKFEVFVADFRGRGFSRPSIRQGLRFGQTDLILKDIPDLIEFTYSQRKDRPFFVVTHSWSGVLLMAALARFPKLLSKVQGVVFFGTKRTIRSWNWQRFVELEIFWNRLLLATSKWKGYLPAKEFKIGSDDETYLTQKHSINWIRENRWIDPVDKFDYGEAIKDLDLPPLLSFAGLNDAYLGNPKDCMRFVNETYGNKEKAQFVLLSRENGHSLDYDHVNMLTAPEAEGDHFLLMVEWMKNLRSQ